MIRRVTSFENEVTILLPIANFTPFLDHPLVNNTIVTDIGFYPNARYHYQQRISGVDEYILFYCIGGSGLIDLGNGNKIELHQGMAYTILPNTTHTYYSSDDHPWSILWLHFKLNNPFFERLSLGESVSILSNEKDGFIQRHFSDLIHYARMDYSLGTLMCLSKSLELLITEIYYLDDGESYTSRYLTKAINYMRENIHTRLSLEDLSNHLGISVTYLSQIFRSATKRSPIDFYISLKVDHAKHLLTISDMSIKQIAFDLGYQDQFYFSRIFKKHVNLSPRDYREDMQRQFSKFHNLK